jgi:hypothetical protein
LRDIAEERRQALNKLADEGGDRPDVHANLDEMRAAYASFYEEAEAIASSTALASRRESCADGAAGRPPMGRSNEAPGGIDGSRTACGPWCRPPPGAGSTRPWSRASNPDAGHLVPGGVRRVRRALALAVRRPDAGLTCVFRVKNEARNLPWVLPPMFEAVQHVVLVDNQSDDGTAEIARRVAEEHGAADRFTLESYPVEVARAGTEHLHTPPDDPRSLTYFYNWSFSHVRTSYSMKWDGDMVLTAEGVELLRDLSWQLEDSAVVAIPRHPLGGERVGGVAGPRLPVPRAVGLPDGAGVHLREGLRVGGPRVPVDE